MNSEDLGGAAVDRPASPSSRQTFPPSCVWGEPQLTDLPAPPPPNFPAVLCLGNSPVSFRGKRQVSYHRDFNQASSTSSDLLLGIQSDAWTKCFCLALGPFNNDIRKSLFCLMHFNDAVFRSLKSSKERFFLCRFLRYCFLGVNVSDMIFVSLQPDSFYGTFSYKWSENVSQWSNNFFFDCVRDFVNNEIIMQWPVS